MRIPKNSKTLKVVNQCISEFFGDPCCYYNPTPRKLQVFVRFVVTLKQLAHTDLTFGRGHAKPTRTPHLTYIFLMITKVFHKVCQNCGKPCYSSVRNLIHICHINNFFCMTSVTMLMFHDILILSSVPLFSSTQCGRYDGNNNRSP